MLKCCFCGREMLWYVDTLLCPVCDWMVIYDLRWDYDKIRKKDSGIGRV